eukprot:5150739-Pyramimonas_sp.AAC.1
MSHPYGCLQVRQEPARPSALGLRAAVPATVLPGRRLLVWATASPGLECEPAHLQGSCRDEQRDEPPARRLVIRLAPTGLASTSPHQC